LADFVGVTTNRKRAHANCAARFNVDTKTEASSTQRAIARIPKAAFTLLAFALVVLASTARAQETVVAFDPASTKVEFTLGATLHSVHGTFQLKRGEVRLDSATGNASGEIVVDATSGETGNADRDKKMHNEVLESEKYPDITFVLSHVNGLVPMQGKGNVEVSGVMNLRGQEHPMNVTVTIDRSASGDLQGAAHFSVPYVKWGLKNPSTFILHVSESVDVDIHTTAKMK
jgi:polyisoprenoid-binding protein YceI